MKTIYKYEVPLILNEPFELELSEDAEILTIQTQNNRPQLWVKNKFRLFYIFNRNKIF